DGNAIEASTLSTEQIVSCPRTVDVNTAQVANARPIQLVQHLRVKIQTDGRRSAAPTPVQAAATKPARRGVAPLAVTAHAAHRMPGPRDAAMVRRPVHGQDLPHAPRVTARMTGRTAATDLPAPQRARAARRVRPPARTSVGRRAPS